MILLECLWAWAIPLLLQKDWYSIFIVNISSIWKPSFALKLYQCSQKLLDETPLTLFLWLVIKTAPLNDVFRGIYVGRHWVSLCSFVLFSIHAVFYLYIISCLVR